MRLPGATPSERALTSAVVLGAGVAGLLAAHVACKHFDKVTLVERDEVLGSRVELESVEESVKRRASVPQLGHPHLLLMGGLHAIRKLLPGFLEQVCQQGGILMDLSADFHVYDFGRTNSAARGPTCLQVVSASRRLLEQALRDRVVADNEGKLAVRERTRAEGLVWSEAATTVKGLLLRGGEVLAADLAIDASGRGSRLPAWLREGGWAEPPMDMVDSRLCYTSRTVQLPEEQPAAVGADGSSGAGGGSGRQAIVILGRPTGVRGGSLLLQEGGTAAVALYGYNGEQAPLDEEGFLDYAASLPDQTLYHALLSSKPISPLIKYAGLRNQLRCYHKVQMPAGVVALGDSIMQLNPVYGQGMSVAAMGALALDAALGRVLSGPAAGTPQQLERGLRQLAGSFQRELFASVSPAWAMASSEDARLPGAKIEGVSRPPRLLVAYMDAVVRAAYRDRPTLETFLLVAHFMKPMWALFGPRVAWQAAKQAVIDAWANWGWAK